jgi:hypothetical protein
VKTASFFQYLTPPSPLKVIRQVVGGSSAGRPLSPNSVVYSAANPLGLVWGPLDDVVMGGSSKSSFDASTGVWKGTVIVESGGFSGIRTQPFESPLDLSGCSGLRLRVKGQGQRLKLIIRDDDQFNGIAWSYSIDTNPLLDTDVKVKLSDFVPTKFARVVEPRPNINAATIGAIQLTYSKFEYDGKLNNKFRAGDFEFKLKEIDTY